MKCFCQFTRLCLVLLLGASSLQGTNIISDQLPEGVTLADIGLGVRPFAGPERAVRAVPFSGTLGGNDNVQQITHTDNHLYVATREGRVIGFEPDGTRIFPALLNLAVLRGSNFIHDIPGRPQRIDTGLRGLAFHPQYASNGLVYTLHREADDPANPPDFGEAAPDAPNTIYSVLGEWRFATPGVGTPSYREVLRIVLPTYIHPAQNIGFNPYAIPGDPDYGLLYGCVGDAGNPNPGTPEPVDPFNVSQDFNSIWASVYRIDPRDPSGLTDAQLLAMGLERSVNGRYGIPLDNPGVGDPAWLDEVYAKGLRHPQTLQFVPPGRPLVGDIGSTTIDEINLVEAGGNYGYPLREGTLIFPWVNPETGAPLEDTFEAPFDAMRYVPVGISGDPSVQYHVRDPDGSNPRVESVARLGSDADAFIYPVAQLSHEPREGFNAIAAGPAYEGTLAEELRGTVIFGDFAEGDVCFIEMADLTNDGTPGLVRQLPLVDAQGNSTDMTLIVGDDRPDFRFGRGPFGNVFIACKANDQIYRLEGTPFTRLRGERVEEAGQTYFELLLTRPVHTSGYAYTAMMSENLDIPMEPVPPTDLSEVSVTDHGDGLETVRYRYAVPMSPDAAARYFRFVITLSEN